MIPISIGQKCQKKRIENLTMKSGKRKEKIAFSQEQLISYYHKNDKRLNGR